MALLKEIQQPEIDKPDLRNFLAVRKTRLDWIRCVAPQLGMDSQKLILHETLTNIVGDDDVFLWGRNFFDADFAMRAKQELLGHLDLEANTVEITPDMSHKIREVHNAVSQLDWSQEDQFKKAVTVWKSMRDFFKNQMESDPYLKEIGGYYDSVSSELNVHWRIFLTGLSSYSNVT
ncbi:hypothetical protein A2Z22_04180 [Candidatus Woesebacteria bacterium RBG_16_34_12]|uniref:Uncharacterized protein n=1 Tax=Candidatus Woesebacteria bacterium RBG_16_34_12 TaxID=1802480 RepID=A0A1F7X7Z1_9BACT|nr:MAG: hypothetical protein A2Z22_04180 [Candidatus Woesebacteria bacterium RBG_16_34_12]